MNLGRRRGIQPNVRYTRHVLFMQLYLDVLVNLKAIHVHQACGIPTKQRFGAHGKRIETCHVRNRFRPVTPIYHRRRPLSTSLAS